MAIGDRFCVHVINIIIFSRREEIQYKMRGGPAGLCRFEVKTHGRGRGREVEKKKRKTMLLFHVFIFPVCVTSVGGVSIKYLVCFVDWRQNRKYGTKTQ